MTKKLRFGLWYDFRNPVEWRQDPARLYEGIIAQCVRAEELGWDDVWLSEHHFIEDGYTPSMLPLAAAIATRTKRVRIGTSVLLLPLHDPLRIAEDSATVDVVSNGRFELGVGAGYRVAEFKGFGIPRKQRDPRMEEATTILRRLFAGERFSFHGEHYRYEDVQLTPLPVQRPLPIWMGGFLPKAVERAGRLGDGFIAIGPMGAIVDQALEAVKANGKDPASYEVAGGFLWLLVARDPERRWKEAFPHLRYQVNLYAKWFTEAKMAVVRPVESIDDCRAQGIDIVRPEQAITMIRDYVAANKVTRFYGWTLPPGLPPEWSDEHVELMAKEVMPAFR
jgi:probable F420-dependent oxidoreductase